MNEQFNYTAQDIERYHRGALSPAQMNAMEKAALDDPFLADALEGYVYTQTASDDVASLQQRLTNRIKKDEKRNPFFSGPQWMKIAALFILIAGGGWLIIQSLSPSPKNEVAVTTSVSKQQTPQTINVDSTSVFSDTTPGNETAAASKKPANLSTQKQYKPANGIPIGKATSDAAPLSVMVKQDTNIATGIASNNVTGYAKDKLESQASTMRKEESVGGRSKPNDTLRNVDVVLQRSDRALEEVVVNPKAKQAAVKPRRMMMVVDTLEPSDGWGYFDDYIASNIKTPAELKFKAVNGEVELSFDVNKEGEPVNIAVSKSLCDRCDKEAIRLLKEGPKWKNKSKKGKVKIKFN